MGGSSSTSTLLQVGRGGGQGLLTALWREIHAEGGDGVLRGVAVQLGHQQVVVLHAQWEFLHVCLEWGGESAGLGGSTPLASPTQAQIALQPPPPHAPT